MLMALSEGKCREQKSQVDGATGLKAMSKLIDFPRMSSCYGSATIISFLVMQSRHTTKNNRNSVKRID